MRVLEAYESFKSHLHLLMPVSANVDVIQFLFGLKPCVRTVIKDSQQEIEPFKKWCRQNNFCWHVDQENFIYFSMNPKLLQQVIHADHSNQKHEELLGNLLGYPECCCKKIAEIGEENIDAFEKYLCQKMFLNSYKLTNPKNYKYGKSYISHVPCSTTCFNSLLIAQKMQKLLLNYKDHHLFSGWLDEV